MNILTVNAGSSSIKFKIFRYLNKSRVSLLLQGQISQIKENPARLIIKNIVSDEVTKCELTLDASNVYLNAIQQLCLNPKFTQYTIDCVINRVVHGGNEYKDIVLLHHKTFEALSKYNELAPFHQPFNLLIAAHFLELYPKIKHYACFDTGFHQTMPMLNRAYAIPWKYTQDGVKRYGFHGLSYSYIADRLDSLVESKNAKGRWIIAHLGSGSSLCGIKNGKSVATTCGFSVLDGLAMSTRTGELDPAIPQYLKSKYQLSGEELTNILYEESGLLGLSGGVSSNIQDLSISSDKQAVFAVEFYALQVASHITKLATMLGGLQGIIFTGGIGENNSIVRSLVLEHLEWLGVSLNKKANNRNKLKISKKECQIKVLVVPTNEEMAMVNLLLEHKL